MCTNAHREEAQVLRVVGLEGLENRASEPASTCTCLRSGQLPAPSNMTAGQAWAMKGGRSEPEKKRKYTQVPAKTMGKLLIGQ